jgi:hypothetical protein
MTKDASTKPVSKRLHPMVNAAIIGLALWFVFSVWLGFAGSEYTDYLLTVASLFVFGSLALPLIAWSVWRHNRKPGAGRESQEDFRDWAVGDLDTQPGRVSATTATIEILLPIAAVAFGMTAFAIVALMNQ